jgi:hypothetical protein
MKKYTKKPVTIDAEQWDGTTAEANRMILEYKIPAVVNIIQGFQIQTLEGYMKVSKGDFIIKGIKGEFYSCKPDIFAMTYDSAN